nr:ferredoxin-thioredoxin reductase catalytic chain, chloroplastic [Ipomoea batatas]GME21134.1 ferredoxin-thioredoxin reductase catalytic chain, chloroplastic [Ipomoea batatas]
MSYCNTYHRYFSIKLRRKPNPSFLRHYLPSQAASIPYNLGFGIPSLATTPSSRPSYAQRRHVVFAKVEREPSEQFVEMRKFSEQHTWKSGTYFCIDKGVIAAVIKRLVEHKDSLGAPFCPCRHYDDKPTEVQQGFCNCPYHPMYLKNMEVGQHLKLHRSNLKFLLHFFEDIRLCKWYKINIRVQHICKVEMTFSFSNTTTPAGIQEEE